MSRRPVADPVFAEIAELIASARLRRVQAVNTWRDHGLVSAVPTLLPSEAGEGARRRLVSSAPTQLVPGPGEKVAALLRQLPWTHHQNAPEGDDA